MVDMASFQAAVGGLKSAVDIVRTLVGLKISSEVQEKVIELQGVILAAQSSALAAQSDQFVLLERVRDLEKQITQYKAWDSERMRYELKQVSGGAFAYSLKEDAKETEQPHWLCTNCYENAVKSVLQKTSQVQRYSIYSCARCKLTLQTDWSARPQ